MLQHNRSMAVKRVSIDVHNGNNNPASAWPVKINLPGSAAGACKIRQSKNSGGPLGSGNVTFLKHFHRRSGLIITDDCDRLTVCNKKATVTASILTPNLHPDNSSEYTKQMAVYCPDCQYSVSELLKSTCPRTRCEFEELTSGGATVALSIIATATLKESVTMTPINTLTLNTACAAWAAWSALRERTGQNRWHVRLGIKPLQRPHCKPDLRIRSIVENKQAFKDTG